MGLFKSLLLSFLWCFSASALAQLTDDFSDGDFSNNPTWTGNDAVFQVNGNQQLQLNDVVASSSYLSTANAMASLDDQEWRIWVKQSFSPSANNFGRVYLVSDQSDLTGPLNGYYLQFGEALGDDAVELFEQSGTTSTSVCRATDGQIASSFEVGVRVVRDNTGLWSLFVDPAGGTDYVFEASGSDLTHGGSSDFGVYCEYTAGNADNFFYDDIYAGPLVVDTDPPLALSANAPSDVLVDVVFDEAVDAITAGTALNYTINNGVGPPSSAVPDADPTIVHLNLGNALVNGQSYTLTITDVEDLNGNAITSQDVGFTYFAVVNAQPGDVLINEIMADPTPQVGLPDAEWVEFHNTSGTPFDLDDWEFSGQDLPSYVLLPGEYVLLIDQDDDAAFNAVPNRMVIPSFPSLTNGGEHIWLISNNGDTIDQVTYSDDWYQDPDKDDGGWTLELINPEAACGGADNWIASNDASGGTPGAENSVYDTTPDLNGPNLIEILVASSDALLLQFDETLGVGSITPSDVVLTPSVSVISTMVTGPDLDQVDVQLAVPLDTGVVYEVVVMNAEDCSGNPMEPTSIPVVIGYVPEPDELVINEIMADPTPVVGLPEVEFVELFNKGTRPLDLGYLTFNGSAMPSGSIVQGGEYALLCHEDDVAQLESLGPTFGLSSFSLVNSGTLLELKLNGQALDWVEFSDQWHSSSSKRDGGWSLERKDPNKPCGFVQANWASSTDGSGGTPGAQNSVLENIPDNNGPILERVLYYGPDQIGLLFDEPLDSLSVLSATYSIDNGLSVTNSSTSYHKYMEVLLDLAPSMVDGTTYVITVNDLNDCAGNAINVGNSGQFAVPEVAESKDVIINEVLSDPRGSGTDFVELYNNSSKVINMRNWKIGKEGEDVQVEDAEVITELPMLLFPGDYLLVSENSHNVATEYPLAHTENFVETDLPSLNNDEGSVVLQNISNTIIDFLRYNDDMHFPLLNSTDGVSLERLDPNRGTNEQTNWHSAAENVGWATPGYLNSQYSPAGITSDDINVEPEVFSPDNDGYQDVVNISWDFDRPGFTGNMTIYDSRGREMRKLMRNELLGTSGTISWDGTMDTGEKCRIGPYVIFFEVFDLDGDVEQFKKTCVLAHQLN